MSDLFGNRIVGFPTRRLILLLDCDVLDAPVRGSVAYTGTTYGNVATYSCDRNYEIRGVVTRECLSDGQWSAVTPDCVLRGKYMCVLTMSV